MQARPRSSRATLRLSTITLSLLSSVLLSGCDGGTTTHIHEAPPTPGDGTGSIDPRTDGAPGTTSSTRVTAPQTDGLAAVGIGTSSLLLADGSVPVVDGVPGDAVDCAFTLPCRWQDAEAQIAVTLGFIDHAGTSFHAMNALTVAFGVTSLRDSAFAVSGVSDIGSRSPNSISLGEGNGNAAEPLLAGQSLHGTVRYDGTVTDSAIDRFAVVLDEAGLAHPATFLNVPIDLPGGRDVNCEQRLPCVWQDPLGSVSVTLTRAGGFVTARRLDIAFRIDADVGREIAMGPGSTAVAHDGFAFEARSHRLGESTGSTRITTVLRTGAPVSGSLDFYRASAAPEQLDSVRLELYENAPLPRWRPGFRNVPSVAP